MSLKEDVAFFKVFDEEMKKWIIPRRKDHKEPNVQEKNQYYPHVKNNLMGLALSGGGIRSATYALGVLQRMARAGILKFVDVLSTASGGGYLGASWSSLTANEPRKDENRPAPRSQFGSTKENFPFRFVDDSEGERRLFDRESDAVRHLRAHGYWLAPHLGIFDVWTWVALLRFLLSTAINLILIPIPWVLVVMMMIAVLIPGGFWNRLDPLDSPIAVLMWAVPASSLLLFSFFIWRHPDTREGSEIKRGSYRFQQIVLIIAVGMLLVDIFILGIWGFYHLQINVLGPWIASVGGSGAALIAAGKAIYNFFSNQVQGGVTSDLTEGIGKKVLGIAIGIIGYVALAILLIAGFVALETQFYSIDRHGLRELTGDPALMWSIFLGALGVGIIMFLMPVRGFLNNFSLQLLYRAGMYKAYILKRKPLDKEVEPRKKGFLLADVKKEDEDPVPDMPYHLIVTAINTSGDDDLKRLGRRSDSFVFANLRSGSRIIGYAKTKKAYGDMPLSEAMAISGAAVSPNMGRVTRMSFSILLTLLNVRLGSWVKNPKFPKGKYILRPPLLVYWIKELLGKASAKDKFIYLSDGGHFDNSAIYELLKRRCRYILAIDAGSDFDNLATVSRLARVDLGVQMDMNLDFFKPDPETELSQQPYVIGRLKYPPMPDEEEPDEGVLVWISTGMIKKQKPDVQKYKQKDPDFPFNTTGDQFFNQEQFEAYRQLGHSAARTLLENAGLDTEGADLDREKLQNAFENLRKISESWQ